MPRATPPLTNLATYDRPHVTPPQLAAYLGCDVRTILRMLEEGSLFGFKVGRNWRIRTSEAQRAFPVEHTCKRTA